MTPEEPNKSHFISKYLSPCRTVGLKRKSKVPNSSDISSQSAKKYNVNGSYLSEQNSFESSNICDDGTSNDVSTSLNFISRSSQLSESSENKSTPKNKYESAGTPVSAKDILKSKFIAELEVNTSPKCFTSSRSQFKSHEALHADDGDNRSLILSPKSSLTPRRFSRSVLKNHTVNIDRKLTDKSQCSSDINFKFYCASGSTIFSKPDDLENVDEIIERVDQKFQRLHHLKNSQAYAKKHDVEQLKRSCEKWKHVCRNVLERLQSELKSRGDSHTTILDLITIHSIPHDVISFDMETQEFT